MGCVCVQKQPNGWNQAWGWQPWAWDYAAAPWEGVAGDGWEEPSGDGWQDLAGGGSQVAGWRWVEGWQLEGSLPWAGAGGAGGGWQQEGVAWAGAGGEGKGWQEEQEAPEGDKSEEDLALEQERAQEQEREEREREERERASAGLEAVVVVVKEEEEVVVVKEEEEEVVVVKEEEEEEEGAASPGDAAAEQALALLAQAAADMEQDALDGEGGLEEGEEEGAEVGEGYGEEEDQAVREAADEPPLRRRRTTTTSWQQRVGPRLRPVRTPRAMQEVADRLWIGSVHDLGDTTLSQFSAVINCMGDYLAEIRYPPHLNVATVVINHRSLGPRQFQEAAEMVRVGDGLTLVHCKMGEQRSATCCAAIMRAVHGIPIETAAPSSLA